MSFGLSEKVISDLQSVFARFPEIQEVLIYGSRAKNSYREGSDIDLTIKGMYLDLSTLNKIELALDDLMLPYKIDLSLFDRLNNAALIEHINRVGISFYKKQLS